MKKKVIILNEKYFSEDFIKRFIKWKCYPSTFDIIDKSKVKKDIDLLIFRPSIDFCKKYPCISHLSNGIIVINNINV